MIETLTLIITYLSYIIMIKVLFKFFYFIYKNFIRKRKDHIKKYGKDTWALVTGGSDGIGKGITIELAKMGFNVLIAARTETKIKNLLEDLKKKYQIKTDYIVVDFNSIDQSFENYENLFNSHFTNKDITILVNNIGSAQPIDILNMKDDETMQQINMNTYPQAYLSKIFINHKKENGAIINMSSLTAEVCVYSHGLYGPTKKFNDYLSKGLALENTKLDILSVRPAGVESALSQTNADGLIFISPETCAKSIFDSLGHEMETNGFWTHSIMAYFFSLIPEYVIFKLSEYLMPNYFSAGRKEYR